RLQLHLDTANPIVWDFGDQSSQTDLNLPPECHGPASAPLTVAASHTYHNWSPPGGFQVRVTENFVVDVTEYWADAVGVHGPVALGTIPVPANPAPQPLSKVIFQEEGVPTGT